MARLLPLVFTLGLLLLLSCSSPTDTDSAPAGFSMKIADANSDTQTCPSTVISISIPTPENVSLWINSATGYHIKTLIDDEYMQAGSIEVEWDLTNDNGDSILDGFYIYELKAGPYESGIIRYISTTFSLN